MAGLLDKPRLFSEPPGVRVSAQLQLPDKARFGYGRSIDMDK